MKITTKLMIATIFGFLLFSCETTELDLLVDPNNLSEEQTEIKFLWNGYQVRHAQFVHSMGNNTGQVMRQTTMSGFQYLNAFGPTAFDGSWDNAYRGTLKNASVVLKKAEGDPLFDKYVAATKIISANILITLVDVYGDVPWSETFNDLISSPKLDTGESVYGAAETLINEAIALIDGGQGVGIENDIYYGSNMGLWKKLANTLKMKIYYQTRLIDANAVSKFEAIVSTGNYINSNNDSFVFNWGSNLLNPNSRHPWYEAGYGPGGVPSIGFYMSNYFMNLMRNTYSVADPRMAFYFYRQIGSYNVAQNAIISALPCLNQTMPEHYPANMVWCRLPNGNTEGWWGRDHGNQDGIPPDGTRRTLCGLYPAGGRTDDRSFQHINNQTSGAEGYGITPIILNSSVHFWRAEMSLFGGSGDFNSHVIAGVNASVSYVSSFLNRDKPTVVVANLPSSAQITTHINEITDRLNNATTVESRMEIWAEQFLISTFGNGLDAYAAYRRTGYPKNIQMNLEPNPGPFMRTFWYPDSEVSANANVTQKPNLTVQTFWDNNPIQGFLQNN